MKNSQSIGERSSSSPTEANEPYHKGQIASRLQQEARQILINETIEDVSARRLCRAVGVTSANFYNHYPSLAFLLLDIASQEFEKRAEINQRIMKRNLGRDNSLILITQNMVEYAVNNHQFFRIMYGHFSDTSINPRYLISADESLRTLVQIIYGDDRFEPNNIARSHMTCAKAYAFVAFMSGLARTLAQGVFANPGGTTTARKRFTETLTRIFIGGLDSEVAAS